MERFDTRFAENLNKNIKMNESEQDKLRDEIEEKLNNANTKLLCLIFYDLSYIIGKYDKENNLFIPKYVDEKTVNNFHPNIYHIYQVLVVE